MIRIENRFQLKQVRAECQAETKQEKCRVLICGGTGCLAGGSAKLYAVSYTHLTLPTICSV